MVLSAYSFVSRRGIETVVSGGVSRGFRADREPSDAAHIPLEFLGSLSSEHFRLSLSHISIKFPDPIFYAQAHLLPYCMGESL